MYKMKVNFLDHSGKLVGGVSQHRIQSDEEFMEIMYTEAGKISSIIGEQVKIEITEWYGSFLDKR
jgi:hypothetical protein